jgi:signal transduction histidine kinase
MATLDLPRLFAPSLQANLLKARCQNAKLDEYPWLQSLCRAVREPLVVLNEDRRVIKANAVLLNLLELSHESQLLGKTIDIREPDGFEVTEEFVQIQDEDYWVVTIIDCRDESRRRTLEKVFLHDILNTAGGVQGLSEVMVDAEPGDMDYLKDTVKNLADQLVDEITAQRDFLAAENGDLLVDPKPVDAGALASMVVQRYCNHPVTGDRGLELKGEASPVVFRTDPTVLSRVLSNMVKNALEASDDTATITVDYGRKPGLKGPGQVWFSVHNPGFIAADLQPQVFTRSFSTKGAGRGLGTYGMRLLSEGFLSGRVEFESHPTEGTTFVVTLPFDGPGR